MNCTAFSFGIKYQEPFIVGLRAVEICANIRATAFCLPYGDQCLSLSRRWFNFVGGYPDQGLMEDYELVHLMRRRAQMINGISGEKFVILPGPPVLCDDRRWRKLGVVKTTWTNSALVNLYNEGMGADELFEKYYGKKIERSGGGAGIF